MLFQIAGPFIPSDYSRLTGDYGRLVRMVDDEEPVEVGRDIGNKDGRRTRRKAETLRAGDSTRTGVGNGLFEDDTPASMIYEDETLTC